MTQTLLDNVTESTCNNIITVEPTVFVSEGTSVCNTSSEKNTTEPVAVQEEKGLKEVKKSMDLNNLSLGQLRAKLKKKLNAKKVLNRSPHFCIILVSDLNTDCLIICRTKKQRGWPSPGWMRMCVDPTQRCSSKI